MSKYVALKDTWKSSIVENFFISYAVEGPMINPSMGVRAGLPVDTPISGPVREPGPLNTRWIYNKPNYNIVGIL